MVSVGSLLFICASSLTMQSGEESYYRAIRVEAPDDVVLEVGGIAFLPDGRPVVCTRRGEAWLIDHAYGDAPKFWRIAQGLQEPLGLLVVDECIYVQQRGELSRMCGDEDFFRPRQVQTVCDAWQISGNYHEYAFGPALDRDGNFWITLNKPFGDEPFGRVKWRGFAMRITPEGEMQPIACGLRSPCGVGVSPGGDVFYTDNQGEWCGASKLAHIRPGDFHGHPWGLESCEDPLWKFPIPDAPPDETPMPEVASHVPQFRLPAVWFPYDKMGRSPAGFAWDETEGKFGPFAGQLFVGDQYAASVMRVFLEQVDGEWQGACFPFRASLSSGVVRVAFAPDGSLFCGETDRGWGSLGQKTAGLERLVWTGETPFEIREMRAQADGFELEFTLPLDAAKASDPSSYALESYTYLLHETYGSDEIDTHELEILSASVDPDARRVRLIVEGLREGYVHELHAKGVRSAVGEPLLHDAAYYTLLRKPAAR